ncbi:hypothetical protein P4H94_31975 [Paenibacillus macerans]|uniref:hypothetical protein n=1 Tax=Paenibacillus macerans TaxID=44252 RepID=UPI000A6A1F58|nr:hypothetical protein [Paenibacillus macerans]MBS5915007.1 hypothetical protein [Paenibacillus macerans]MCY7561375.1 hypothetical protein [Paenibacillus macerans]MEC0141467.1 hypothetical protein [Paenibacillus macerans]MEC0154529.1 hypothetical protein [Paenibacillus macerans]MEC0332773.1 hypothetical protein [Paenibacillus macerans]
MKARDDKQKPIIKEQPATYGDYARLPDDGKRYELADGGKWPVPEGANKIAYASAAPVFDRQIATRSHQNRSE